MINCTLQEHLNYVTEISQDELFVLDPELVLTQTVGTSPAVPDLVDVPSTPTSQHLAVPALPQSTPVSRWGCLFGAWR